MVSRRAKFRISRDKDSGQQRVQVYTYVRVAVRSSSPGSTPSVHPHSSGHVRAKNGTVARVHARACRATRFQPLRNKSSEENLPEGINVGVGSPHVLCPPRSYPGEG